MKATAMKKLSIYFVEKVKTKTCIHVYRKPY